MAPTAGEPRRRLGDAWQDWDPARSDSPIEIRDGPAAYAAFQSGLALLLGVAWLGVVWLIQPRLEAAATGPSLRYALQAGGSVAVLLPSLLLWGMLAGLRLPVRISRGLEFWLVGTWGPTQALASRLGLSRDRLGHAFVLLANRLSLQSRRSRTGSGLLVLAPRCLRPDQMRELKAMAVDAGARFVVAVGGEEARAAVFEGGPAAVLAVACERDLVTGMSDVLRRRTVLGIANRRPDGPCRNSEIDLDEAGRLLATLQGLVRTPAGG